MSRRTTTRTVVESEPMADETEPVAESGETPEPVVPDTAILVAEPAVPEPIEDLGEPAPYEARVIDPEPEPEPAPEAPLASPEETPLEVPDGSVVLVYRGTADLLEHGAYKFRVGQPVVVPSAVAEELLTYPFETFERV